MTCQKKKFDDTTMEDRKLNTLVACMSSRSAVSVLPWDTCASTRCALTADGQAKGKQFLKSLTKWFGDNNSSCTRFSLLLLDHDEYYFRWHEAVAHFDIGTNRRASQQHEENSDKTGKSGSARICAPGLLHICGNGIFFEPHDVCLPIIRAPFKSLKKLIPWDISDNDKARLQSLGIDFASCQHVDSSTSKLRQSVRGWLGKLVQKPAHKQTNSTDHSWELLLVDADQIITMCCNGAHHPYSKVDSFDPICFAVKPDPIMQDQERSVMETLSLLVAIHAQSAHADFDKLLQKEITIHETQGLAHSPPLSHGEHPVCRGLAVQIEPLLAIPGRFLLTNKAIYFFAFHKRRSEDELCISLSSLFRVARRRHTFDPTALELKHKNGTTFLFAFSSPDDCSTVWRHLIARPSLYTPEHDELQSITRAWQAGAVSNYHYLLHLNALADRSFHDLAQYPVMPWVLSDYTSPSLDLTSPAAFRDLSKPIGALQPDRLADLRHRYEAMDPPKYLYGTHYSTPAYVVFFLVRRAPLLALRFHSGRFDTPDRAFSTIASTWATCLHNPADVKELIPEFYAGGGDFLLNRGRLPLGVKQTGEVVHHVTLPPWAESPGDFVAKCRAALESDHVSSGLHQWIDLIFGCLQRGDAAVAAHNVFHPLSYAAGAAAALGDARGDERIRRACFDHISEFGQVPKQLFRDRHPRRTGALLLRPIGARPPAAAEDKSGRPAAAAAGEKTDRRNGAANGHVP